MSVSRLTPPPSGFTADMSVKVRVLGFNVQQTQNTLKRKIDQKCSMILLIQKGGEGVGYGELGATGKGGVMEMLLFILRFLRPLNIKHLLLSFYICGNVRTKKFFTPSLIQELKKTVLQVQRTDANQKKVPNDDIRKKCIMTTFLVVILATSFLKHTEYVVANNATQFNEKAPG